MSFGHIFECGQFGQNILHSSGREEQDDDEPKEEEDGRGYVKLF